MKRVGAQRRGRPERIGDLPCSEASAVIAGLAGVHQVVEDVQRDVDRSFGLDGRWWEATYRLTRWRLLPAASGPSAMRLCVMVASTKRTLLLAVWRKVIPTSRAVDDRHLLRLFLEPLGQ